MNRSFFTFVTIFCLCGVCPLIVGQTVDSSTCKAEPISTPTPSPPPPPPPARAMPTSGPQQSKRLALAGVRPMQDRTNSTDPIPCTCGIFMSSQIKGREQPKGLPAISHEFTRSTTNSAYGLRQCTTACVDMIVKHLPSSAPILCSSIERDCMREKAFLYIKNNRNKWIPTRLSAGREFCCKGGVSVRCPQ